MKCLSGRVMCVINFVNSWPMEWTFTTRQAQIRTYIRECRRVDLFQSSLIALSNSGSVFGASMGPSFPSRLYLLIPLHSPEESPLCAATGNRTEAQRWIQLRVTWFRLSAWPSSKFTARLLCRSVVRENPSFLSGVPTLCNTYSNTYYIWVLTL